MDITDNVLYVHVRSKKVGFLSPALRKDEEWNSYRDTTASPWLTRQAGNYQNILEADAG